MRLASSPGAHLQLGHLPTAGILAEHHLKPRSGKLLSGSLDLSSSPRTADSRTFANNSLLFALFTNSLRILGVTRCSIGVLSSRGVWPDDLREASLRDVEEGGGDAATAQVDAGPRCRSPLDRR